MPSEDVLLQVSHVKYKKDEGTLYLMSERIGWIQGNKDTVSLSHHYSDIKAQKISPEGKPKIQLQIILHDNTTFTFQFVHPEGPGTQSSQRNNVKEHLMHLLQTFKRQINPELEEKNRILMENPTLLQLYRDLVTTTIVSSDEFWRDHAQSFINKSAPAVQGQETGVSSGFLTGIQPSTDGVNGIVYNLTTDLMESIFKTYPAVRKKHRECVPALLSESEFWNKFFQSHYFHRDRLPVSKDVFYSCAKADDKEMRRGVESMRSSHNELCSLMTAEDGDKGEEGGSGENNEGKEGDLVSITPHRNLIKRFNQHSIMLLKAGDKTNPPSAAPLAVPEGEPPKKKNRKEREKEKEEMNAELELEKLTPNFVESKLQRTLEKIELEDLREGSKRDYQPLNLTKIGRYLNGPVPSFSTESLNLDAIGASVAGLRDVGAKWTNKLPLLDSKTALNILGDLSPGGCLMKTTAGASTTLSAPPEIEDELRNNYVCLSELLRHFWSSFPTTSPALIEKARKSHERIKKFEEVKLSSLNEKLARDHLSLSLSEHLNLLINSAHHKYNRWAASMSRGRR